MDSFKSVDLQVSVLLFNFDSPTHPSRFRHTFAQIGKNGAATIMHVHFNEIDDVVRFRRIFKSRKIQLKSSVDFTGQKHGTECTQNAMES